MAPSRYSATYSDGRLFSFVAGSDHGAIRRAESSGQLAALTRDPDGSGPRAAVSVRFDRRATR